MNDINPLQCTNTLYPIMQNAEAEATYYRNDASLQSISSDQVRLLDRHRAHATKIAQQRARQDSCKGK